MTSATTTRRGRWWRRAATGLVCAAGLSAADAPKLGAQTSDVAGVVVDVETGRGVPDVILRVLGTDVSAASDEAGRFVIRGVPRGTWFLQVDHLAYGSHRHEIAVDPDVRVELEIRVAAEAIELEPLVVEGVTTLEREKRTTGASFWEVTRPEIERAMGTSRHMGDLLRQTVPGLRLRQSNSLAGNTVCLEFRAAASISIVNQRPCNHPMVLVDGVPISNPEFYYGTTALNDLERIQLIPPGEAGARYGSGSLYGVLLIETRRPGLGPPPTDAVSPLGLARTRLTFDWAEDPAGHSTGRALLGSVVGNVVGLAVGLTLARQCIDVVNEQIESSCAGLATVGSGAAAFVLPAVGSAYGVRLAGGTDLSVGRLAPALIGAGMMLFPGYAFSLSTVGGDVAVVNTIGYAFLAVGVPVAVTIADRLFRRLR